MQAYLDKAADAKGTAVLTLTPETAEERAALDSALQAKAHLDPETGEVHVKVIAKVIG